MATVFPIEFNSNLVQVLLDLKDKPHNFALIQIY